MIRQLNITNFRCYEKTSIFFNGTSILVGRNNAGKSTMIEALKIISSVTRKYRILRFIAPPEWVPKENNNGVSPNVENMNISDRGIFNMYGNPPAIIEAIFTNGSSIKAYVGEGLDIFAIITDEYGCQVRNSKEAKCVDIPVIEVLPQISAVLDSEKVIKKATVDGNRSTRLASRNFRNQLFYYGEAFPTFQKLAEATWEGLQVKPVESIFADEGRILQFFVRVHDFEAEISWMGHGLQMWVQTMWFISQCPSNAIVVLDEPDVYMHADLQRRLVRLITPMFSQLIVATHSLEIIEEVSSDCIIPIDSHKRNVKPIGDEVPLQHLSEELGSPLNIDLARLFVSNRFIVWDGDDSGRKILSAFQSVLYPQDLHPIITFPKAFVEGWNGWKKAVTIADVFSVNRMNVQLYCIFEGGYHTMDEIHERRVDAREKKINLHVWDKKEIENYAINPDVIFRYLFTCKRKGEITMEMLKGKINEIVAGMKDEVLNGIAAEIQRNTSGMNEEAMEDAWEELNNRWIQPLDIILGRRFFINLSMWTQENYGVSVSARQVIPFFKPEEVPYEVQIVISAIMEGEPL